MLTLRNPLRFIFSATLLLLISGCTQRFEDINATFKEVVWGSEDIHLPKAHVDELPYASIYARINDGGQIFMVLAFADTNPETGRTQLQWLSTDRAMIATENGRIVKTQGLPFANLAGLSQVNQPLPDVGTKSEWQAEYDWQPGYHYGQRANVSSKEMGQETVTSLLWEKSTTKITEQVSFATRHSDMTNHFWLDDTNQVVKTKQWLVPDKLFIELEILKPYIKKQ